MYGVGWQDYGQFGGPDGLGGWSVGLQADLAKALQAGHNQNNPGASPGVGFPMLVESLEDTLRVLTYDASDFVLWRNIPKLPATNVIEEDNVIKAYGQDEVPAWIPEGGLPEESDPTYDRQYTKMKYLGRRGRVTYQMALVKAAHGPQVQRETVNKTMDLLNQADMGLYYGDEDLSPLQWNGFEKLIRSGSPALNIKDLEGRSLTDKDLNDSCLVVREPPNHGRITDMYLTPTDHGRLSELFFPKQRVNLEQLRGSNKVTAGTVVDDFMSAVGRVSFRPHININNDRAVYAAAAGVPSKIPGVPSLSVGAAASAGTAANKFRTTDAGDYRYRVVAWNDYGHSTALTVTPVVTVAAGQKVTFTLTAGAGPIPRYYEIFRSPKDGAASSERSIARVPYGTGPTTVITDENARRPGTRIAIMFQFNLQAISFKQLGPMIRIPFGTNDFSIHWGQGLFGAPVLYAKGKIFMFENIGDS